LHVANIQTRSCMSNWYDDVSAILLDFVDPFIKEQRNKFVHWHYFSEPDDCRGRGLFKEIRLRFEGDDENLNKIKSDLIRELEEFSEKTHLTMKENEPLGSHEGCHGKPNNRYLGAESEKFGRDFPVMVEIWQKGSEFAIELFRQGRTLVEKCSLQYGYRPNPIKPNEYPTTHPCYLHYPANQLLLEP